MSGNPMLFPGPVAQWNYSRFPAGQIGTTINGTSETGTESKPEAVFQIPPGQAVPSAWSNNIGNAMGPGGRPNGPPKPLPTGVISEQQFANQ